MFGVKKWKFIASYYEKIFKEKKKNLNSLKER
jgi:hypothetical protein